MRVSVRRTLRVGKLDGAPLEDLGVRRDEPHYMTRDDVLHGNRHLIEHAASLLERLPFTGSSSRSRRRATVSRADS